jgi:hypothetical protein
MFTILSRWVLRLVRTRRTWTVVALLAVLSATGCGDDSPGDESPAPAGTEAGDTPEGVTDSAATVVDADVPASNVSNAADAPLEPSGDD